MHATMKHQHGAAALVVTLLLFLAMVLTALFVNRNLVFEQRSAANQYRSTLAFEAAEAGLEWALAQLGRDDRLGADCRPASGSGALSLSERYLRHDAATGVRSGATWNQAGVATPLQPACVRSGDGWACHCPSNGHPQLAAPASAGPAPAFSVAFQPGSRPGLLRIVASGCSSLGGACLPGSTASADAVVRNEVTLALLPAVAAPPGAPLTARGGVDVGTAALGVHNADAASGGVLIDAGGAIQTSALRHTVPAGSSLAGAYADHDGALAALSPDALFFAHFGMGKAAWRRQPGVRQVVCNGDGGDCGAALQAALGATGHPLVGISGDAMLQGPLTLGSADRPVILVAEGGLRLSGAVAIHGLVYAATLSWQDTSGPGALLRGAAVVEGDYRGNGAPDLYFDAPLLARLKQQSGAFARVPGSWRDFQ